MTQNTRNASSRPTPADIRLVIAIPARLGSTRLPRKPLALLKGEPLIVRVAQRVSTCVKQLCDAFSLQPSSVLTFVATDSPEIVKALESTSIQSVMTASNLPSGTDRILSALDNLPQSAKAGLTPNTLVINLQGDEPFFSTNDVESLVRVMFASPHIPMGTLAFPRTDSELFFRTSVVKVVCAPDGRALYFSRSPIPWPREHLGASESVTRLQEKLQMQTDIPFLQHVGIYAYQLSALRKFTQLPPSALEQTEGLEQLRALEAGWTIQVAHSCESPFGIDTPEDLLRAEMYISGQGHSE